MKMTVIADAWISVSRSGHWTRFSSAQQEAMKPMTLPRWRSVGSSLGALRRSDSFAAALRSRSAGAPLPAGDLVRRLLGRLARRRGRRYLGLRDRCVGVARPAA